MQPVDISSKQEDRPFRAFLGVGLSAETQQEIGRQIRRLEKNKKFNKIKWVKESNLHITLAFLGDISLVQSQQIVAGLRDVLSEISAFALESSSLMAFPSEESPRILAMVLIPKGPLIGLVDRIKTVLKQCDIPVELRPYVPHLTIGRIKHPSPLTTLGEIAIPPVSIEVNTVSLFRSELTPKGPVYSALYTIELFT